MENDFKSYGDLELELQDAKHTLLILNNNIRRVIGHETTVRSELKRVDSERYDHKHDLKKNIKRRSIVAKSVFNRLSASIKSEGDSRPRLNSRVIKELPSRQEVVAAQGTDSQSKARNKRMFSSLLGTLHKFCQEESRLKEKEEKKAQIEKKLEEQEILERSIIKKERELLFMNRKRKQIEIKILETKLNRLKDFELWKTSVAHLKQSIRTKSQPHIYYRPKVMDKKTEGLLRETQNIINSLVEEIKTNVDKELCETEDNFRSNNVYEDFENANKNYKEYNEIRSDIFNNKIDSFKRVDDSSQSFSKSYT